MIARLHAVWFSRRAWVSVAYPAFLILFTADVTHAGSPRKLTLAQAVRAAERFVALNGYTHVPPTTDRSKLSDEFMSLGVQSRRNTLEPKAYGYAKHRFGSKPDPGWTIIFRRTKSSLRPRYRHSRGTKREQGRGVTMNPYGHDMRMEHTDPYLWAYTRLSAAKSNVKSNQP